MLNTVLANRDGDFLEKQAHDVWRIGEWRVSPSLCEISRDGYSKKLDYRVMRLLMFLAERPGQLVAVPAILDGVWGKAIVTPHSVYEAIAALRQALGDTSESPQYIVNLPRRGYRLIAEVSPPTSAPVDPGTVELSAEGTSSGGTLPASRRRSTAVVVGAVAAVLVGMTLLVTWLMRTVPTPPKGSPEKSIAVLPFVDLSQAKDQEYLADGLAEELLDVLVHVPGLRVVAHTSSFQFKNRNEDVRGIGEKLGVAYVVEGSVRRAGTRVRVAAQLIRASDGVHEWSSSYDRDVGDTLQLESELAAAVGRALELSVAPDVALSGLDTTNQVANEHYLRGLHALDAHTRAGAEEAADEFRAAVAADPQFSGAYASLAMTYYVQAAFHFVEPEEGFTRVRVNAQKALNLNPRSAIGHALLARVATLYSWDWLEAQREADTALVLAPQDPFALYAGADLAAIVGDFQRSERLFRASLVSDPLDPETHFMLALDLQTLGRLREAEAEARRCLAISPAYVFGHHLLALSLMLEGHQGEETVNECKLEPPDGGQLNCLAQAYGRLGRMKDSDAVLSESIRTRASFGAFGIARVYADRGQADLAFQWVDRAYRQRDSVLPYIKGDSTFAGLRGDPRYKAVLQKLQLPP